MVKIFVGRLAPSVSPIRLRELFENYGPVSDCDILRDYGFVHMSRESDAQRAINALDKFDLCGSRLSVELSTSRSMKSCQLNVQNLPDGITSQDLHKLFKKFGTVTLCRISSSNATVHMRFPSMANNAVRNLSGELYRGNVLSVEFANNITKPWIRQSENYETETRNGLPDPKPFMVTTIASKPNKVAWKQVPLHENVESSPVTSDFRSLNSGTQNKVSELSEGRRQRIKQGLKFLQSPMPWSGTTELYETFLNQLKEMLLEDGPELYREGNTKEAIAQLSEAINICNYMKTEGIKGHMENLDKLLLERATILHNSGNTVGALEDAERALNISNNQNVVRFKVRLLAECGRRQEALYLMIKFQQTQNFDAESLQLLNILKQSMGVSEDTSNGLQNSKGAIGDGRSRPGLPPLSFPNQNVGPNAFASVRTPWPVVNGGGDHKNNAFAPSYTNFGGNTSALIGSGLRSLQPSNESFSQRGSQFHQFFNQGTNAPSSTLPSFPSSLLDNHGQNPVHGPISRPNNNSTLFSPPTFQAQSKSLFSSDPYGPGKQMNGSGPDQSLPLPIGFRRPQPSLSHSSTGSGLWSDNISLGMPSVGSESNVDKLVDEELARAIEEELSTSTSSNSTFSAPSQVWQKHSEHSNNVLPFKDNNTPSYSHFPAPSKVGFTGSVLGPAMLLGIHTTIQSTVPTPAPQVTPSIEPPKPAVISANATTREVAENNDSLSEILRNPLHDTHEFKLGCTECVLRTGSRVVDFRHNETTTHSCYKNILLCRRRGNSNWLKIRPRPQPQSKAQLYDGPYYICKDLMSGQDCTYPAVCTFAYNQEEIDVWTLERKGMLNRTWLCKSMDASFVKNLSLVGLILCKHRGTFDFLCKMCFQNKPRIISQFSSGKCTNENTPHRDITEHQQLTHILRESTVRYTEIRSTQQAILCRHAIRFQCTRGSDCHFAHSLVERDIWAIMDKEDLSAVDIVKQSIEHMNKQSANNQEPETNSLFAADSGLTEFRWKSKFICSLCHKNGQVSEATKDMKYCTARAQHSWTTNKKVMLVNTVKRSWVQVRDLPYLKNKNLPVRFELCENFRRQKKCTFSVKCNFAHSQEEMDIWMYLRENQLKDLEELYDALSKAKPSEVTKSASTTAVDASSIILPSDIIPLSAYHCWLCDRECNGQRQWEKHCLSEKHKLRAISDSDGHWRFRKPTGNYKLCERHEKGVCEYDFLPASENACSYAHSKAELEEWIHRRQYVINRIQKAKDDRLIDKVDDVDNLISPSSQS